MARPVIGLALGGGAARGWSHLGVIRALNERGVNPDVVCGTSMGALVGAGYAAGYFDKMNEWATRLTRREVLRFLDIRLAGGLIGGERLFDYLRGIAGDIDIEACELPFGAVATNLVTGNEVWLRKGKLLDAVRASAALPGLLAPFKLDEHWLVDGGLVNPVPVSLCRAMGAEIVVAVELNSDLLERRRLKNGLRGAAPELDADATEANWSERLGQMVNGIIGKMRSDEERVPSMLEVLARSNTIMSVRITRSRMAGDPPDILLSPRLAHISLMDFHRAREASAEGYEEVQRHAERLAYYGL